MNKPRDAYVYVANARGGAVSKTLEEIQRHDDDMKRAIEWLKLMFPGGGFYEEGRPSIAKMIELIEALRERGEIQ